MHCYYHGTTLFVGHLRVSPISHPPQAQGLSSTSETNLPCQLLISATHRETTVGSISVSNNTHFYVIPEKNRRGRGREGGRDDVHKRAEEEGGREGEKEGGKLFVCNVQRPR